MMDTYVPLWVKSNYSFLEGASHPEELVQTAHDFQLPAMAITDRDGVYGVVRAHAKAKELKIPLIIGAQVTVAHESSTSGDVFDPSQVPQSTAVFLVQNREGYANLCALLSQGRSRCPKGQSLVFPEEVETHGSGLLALISTLPLLHILHDTFKGQGYALCARHYHFTEHRKERELRDVAKQLSFPAVGAVEVLYHDPSRRPVQDIVECLRHHKTLHTAGTCIRKNAEHHLKSGLAMQSLFADTPSLLQRTLEIAERCHFSLDELRYRYPGERIPEGKTEQGWLRELTYDGAQLRYPAGIPSRVCQQLDRELEIICTLEYGGYFLTMWEIVQFCRQNNILCQGRGSAANSAVCYCLGITAIDPIQMDLLFERFLSLERAEPPDIDLDIEHQRREEVIQWVYRRSGRRHAAMVANIVRYRARSAIREVGKALGIPQTDLDRAAKLLSYFDRGVDSDFLTYAGLDPQKNLHRHLLHLTREIIDFPRHLSIHPGGFLLGNEPVDSFVPIEPATMDDRTVIQWDKYDIETLGLFKVDLLGLGALSQAHICFDLLKEHENIPLDLASIPANDTKTYEMISRGDTVGVFQIESRAQMSMLPRLKPRNFYDLVVEIAIVRPGPIQGDMVHPYLKRRNGEEPIEYPHEKLKPVLSKTFGVPIFQEQVMKLAVLVADYTPGEADQLRRDMAAWRSTGRIEQHKGRLIQGMKKNGVPPDFAERIFSQIRGFGEYGFPESHAASFALIAYTTSWIRCHYPHIFTCGLLNAQPMGFYSVSTIVEDAKRHGIEVLPIDIQRSKWDATLEPRPKGDGYAVRMGFRFVKGMGERQKKCLERGPGPYPFPDDFVRRTGLHRKVIHRLAEAGAFESFGLARRDAIWLLRSLTSQSNDRLRLSANIASTDKQPSFPSMNAHEAILWDHRTSVHSTRGHLVESIRPQLRRRGIPTAGELNQTPDGRRASYVGMVICRQRPGTASGVTFFTLEDETGFVNLVVWRPIFERHSILAKSAMLLGVQGKIQSVEGVVHLVVETMWEPQLQIIPEGTRSRDFH